MVEELSKGNTEVVHEKMNGIRVKWQTMKTEKGKKRPSKLDIPVLLLVNVEMRKFTEATCKFGGGTVWNKKDFDIAKPKYEDHWGNCGHYSRRRSLDANLSTQFSRRKSLDADISTLNL